MEAQKIENEIVTLGRDEIAKIMRVGPRTIEGWVRFEPSRLPGFARVGKRGRPVWRRDVVEDWFYAQENGDAAEAAEVGVAAEPLAPVQVASRRGPGRPRKIVEVGSGRGAV